MSSDFMQALAVIGLITVACTIVSPLLVWLLKDHTKTT